MRFTVVVLGEIGQSPRMLYHIEALAARGVEIDLIAYAGDATPDRLRGHPAIRIHGLPPPGLANRHRLARPVFLAYALSRQLYLSLRLTWLLLAAARKPDTILMQTPPAIPTMLACLIAARLRGSRLVFDWHNYGYTILALRFGAGHPAVRFARLWERWFARRADLHLCVSAAMRKDLAERWDIPGAVVLRDLPAAHFRPLRPEERAALVRSLCADLSEPAATLLARAPSGATTVLVSPTSWTADEDFSLLFEALAHCEAQIERDEAAAAGRLYPDLMVWLTGRGPLREEYRHRASDRPTGRIHVEFAWLTQDYYAALLGAADLGICVHASSSGLDLPMKIADMQGAGLPVCAYDYGACLEEMIAPGETGLLFKDARELAAQLCALLRGFAQENGLLARMRSQVAARRGRTWDDAWADSAAPLFGLPSAHPMTDRRETA